MSRFIAAILIGVLAAPISAQVTLPPEQSASDATIPIFRVTVVGRTTQAINYRPRSGETKVDLVGTPLMPQASGSAEVSGKKGHFEIDARFEHLQPAGRFGREYLTYVLWAITPEGRPRNLGEVQLQGTTSEKTVTTELQAFALILTAEPYFAVTRPSDVVVMENVVRNDTRGAIETVDAKYELLQRGSYLMDKGVDFPITPLEPGAPLDLAEARNAVALARIAGADRHAADTLSKAERLLTEAERARETGTKGDEVMMPARQAAQTAEDARLIAMKRLEEAFVVQQQAIASQQSAVAAQQSALAAQREQEALDQQRRAENEANNASAARVEAERERLEVERTRDELQEARMQALRAQAAAAVVTQERNELRERLREQLNAILETRESARGLIMNVPDVLFVTGSARLNASGREKLARVSGILAAQPDLRVAAEGHTDNVGGAEQNQRLSERRAGSVLAYLVQQKIPVGDIDTAGFGETRPVASNDTPAGRQQNRRVELVVSGASIGRVESSAPQ
jgi:outer membrane protein OmpA-like peptidoglycan-associated protein